MKFQGGRLNRRCRTTPPAGSYPRGSCMPWQGDTNYPRNYNGPSDVRLAVEQGSAACEAWWQGCSGVPLVHRCGLFCVADDGVQPHDRDQPEPWRGNKSCVGSCDKPTGSDSSELGDRCEDGWTRRRTDPGDAPSHNRQSRGTKPSPRQPWKPQGRWSGQRCRHTWLPDLAFRLQPAPAE